LYVQKLSNSLCCVSQWKDPTKGPGQLPRIGWSGRLYSRAQKSFAGEPDDSDFKDEDMGGFDDDKDTYFDSDEKKEEKEEEGNFTSGSDTLS